MAFFNREFPLFNVNVDKRDSVSQNPVFIVGDDLILFPTRAENPSGICGARDQRSPEHRGSLSDL